ncbi:MAG: DUF4422 domain-containing protein [Clostridia bacterium]|nr:DUF4422 domain-containing protein [Clostridia bacterium]
MGQIYIAAHKEFKAPEDPVYLPIFLGKSAENGFAGAADNTGDNITDKNACYCELTGIYWIWKNAPKTDYVGLVHYRRYLCEKGSKTILSQKSADQLMKEFDVVLPKKRNYYIETCYSQYKHAHNIADLDRTREIIGEIHPEYVGSFDKVMAQRSIYIYNMFIMKQELFDEYCEWLFPVLFELEKRSDISHYNDYNRRLFGFISERLFNVWLDYRQPHSCELPYIFTEKQNLLWKYILFILRKLFGGRRYEK